MAAKDVVIKISATDTASPTFKRIASEAKSMGAQVDASGKQASASLDKVKASGLAVGVAAGAMVGGISLAGAAFVSQEQQIRGLNRAYGESSESIQKFAKELQQTTTYSDDAARQSAQIAATLTRSYGLTADQIELLISTTADLASVNLTAEGRQFSLADAVQRTSSAIRGEAESAEALGLTLSDSAVAAAAAARGLTGWTTTMTEAEKAQFRFTLLLEQSAYAQGAAAEAAETNAGKARQFLNVMQDQVQGIGGASGAAGEYLSVMSEMALVLPLVTGMLGKLGGAFAALGGAPVIAGAAVLAGSGLLAYDANTNPYGTGSDIFAQFGAGGAGLANALLPGNPFSGIQDQFTGILQGNDLVEAAGKLFYQQPGTMSNVDPGTWAIGRLKTAGILPADFSGTIDDAARYIESSSNATGMSKSQYVERKLSASTTYTYDPVSGQYVYNDTLTGLSQERRLAALPSVGYDPRQGYGSMYAIAQGQAGTGSGLSFTPTGNYDPAIYAALHRDVSMATLAPDSMPGLPQTGATTSLVGANAAAEAKAAADAQAQWTRAIEETYGAYAGLVLGIDSASDATTAFKAVQDGLLGEQEVYNQQLGEYNSQLNAQEAAYKILEERQANGIALTQEQTEFMNNYAHATEIGTGAAEDATLAAGMLAQQYLLNKETGDAMNATLNGTNEVLGTIAEALTAYILTLQGVPEEVRTELILNSDPAMSSLYEFLGLIPSSVTIPMYVSGQQVLDFMGGGAQDGTTMNAYAGGGTHYGGGHALVGERGPEIVWLPNGSQVMNTEGSKSRMQAGSRGGRGNFVNQGTINFQMNTPDVYGAVEAYALGGAR